MFFDVSVRSFCAVFGIPQKVQGFLIKLRYFFHAPSANTCFAGALLVESTAGAAYAHPRELLSTLGGVRAKLFMVRFACLTDMCRGTSQSSSFCHMLCSAAAVLARTQQPSPHAKTRRQMARARGEATVCLPRVLCHVLVMLHLQHTDALFSKSISWQMSIPGPIVQDRGGA